MRRESRRPWGPVRASRFPMLLFGVIFGGTLLASGIHMGIIVLMNTLQWNELVQTILPIMYWAAVSAGLTLFSVQIIKNTYERPVQMLAKAAQQVANGDFSVFVPAVHSADKVDYLDAMIQDFNKMVAELGSIETLKTDFFSNVSHEIKTPLAAIQNSADLLKNPALSEEERAEYVDTIARSSRRLNGLITNILKLNKLEKQTIRPVPEPYDLCQQLAECALLFENRWEEKDIEFEADIEDVATIEADANLLELVWNNLLSNAIKFTEPGGTVTLRQTSTASEAIVEVADTGYGMDEKTLEHIFDKFYQGDTSHSTEGNGLGLALVLRILRIVGLIGTAFMAGATFAVVHAPPLYVLCTVLAVPGFIGWILPYFIYRKLCAKRGKVVAELVEQKYDEIYEICEQGNKLLNRKTAPLGKL